MNIDGAGEAGRLPSPAVEALSQRNSRRPERDQHLCILLRSRFHSEGLVPVLRRRHAQPLTLFSSVTM